MELLRKKLSGKILALCIMAVMFCVPASADDVIINTSLITSGFATLTVNINGEISHALTDKYVYGDVVTLTAPDVTDKTFNYWANEEGKPISYNKELTLTIYSNTVISAVYGTDSVTPQPATEFLSIIRSLSMFMFNVAATAPSDSTVTEYGIRYSTTKNTLEGLKGDEDVTVKTAYSNSNYLFDVVGSDDKVYYVVSYVKSGGQTYYSEVKAAELSDLKSGFSYVAGLTSIQMGKSFDAVGGTKESLQTALRANLLKVSFDVNGGTGTMTPQGFLKNSLLAITPAKFTRDYYTFNGWNTNANGSGTSYKDGASISLTQNMTLYAQWKANEYAISYDLKGGSVSSANPISYDVTTAKFKLNNPTRTGYMFAGWKGTNVDVNLSKDVTISTGSAGNREYVATWKAIEYTISYTLNNGSVSGNPTKYTIENEAITLNNPTKNGYQFDGWTGTDLNGTTQTLTLAKGSTGNRNYTANFTPITYTITYELND